MLVEDKYISGENFEMHYTLGGQGSAVVLLHGFMESVQIWKEMAPLWSKNFKVLCIDLPGHGESKISAPPHTMEAWAHWVYRIMQAEGVEKAVIIGHSMGGYVALALADLFPQAVAGLGLFHSHAAAEDESGKENRNKIIRLLEEKEEKLSFITRFMPSLFAPQNQEHLSKRIDQLVSEAQTMKAEALIASQKGMRDRKSYLPLLAQADFPFLFVIGSKDQKSPIAKVVAQMMMCKKAEVLWLPCGHMGFWEEEASCTSFTEGFIRRVCAL